MVLAQMRVIVVRRWMTSVAFEAFRLGKEPVLGSWVSFTIDQCAAFDDFIWKQRDVRRKRQDW